MFENSRISLIIVLWHLNNDSLLFDLPKGVKYSIGNNHNVGLILLLLDFTLLFSELMHVSQHLNGRRTGGYFKVFEHVGLLFLEVFQQTIHEQLYLGFVRSKSFLLFAPFSSSYPRFQRQAVVFKARRNSVRFCDLLENLKNQIIDDNCCNCLRFLVLFLLIDFLP